MGKGKGNPEYWVAVVKPGRMLFEVNGATAELAKEAFRLGAAKLPSRPAWLRARESSEMKKAHEYRDMSYEELESLVEEKSEDLLTLRMQLNMRRLDNALSVRVARRELAVIKTVMNEKKREEV